MEHLLAMINQPTYFCLYYHRSQNLPNSLRICAGNFFSRLHSTKSSSTSSTSTSSSNVDTKVSREEMLRLFILKLDEEANYFDASPSPEEELCECSKCQVRTFYLSQLWFKLLTYLNSGSNFLLISILVQTFYLSQFNLSFTY